MRMRGEKSAAPPARKVVRCAIYTRKSTAYGLEQEFNSLDNQREACEAYARARAMDGWTVLPERFDDGDVSGGSLERPGFKRLMAAIEAGNVDVVLVYKLDRLTRSVRDLYTIIDRFEELACKFVVVAEAITTEGAMGRMFLTILASVSQFQRESTAEWVTDKMRATRRRGLWCGGRPPLGYKSVAKKLVLDEPWAPLARDAIHLWLELGETRTAIVLNESGRLRPFRLRGDSSLQLREWRKNDVLALVRSPCYGGYLAVDDELIPAQHDPLIDARTFHAVRAKLEARTAAAGEKADARRTFSYLLSGLLRCGRCGYAMTGASARNRHGTAYRYYRCTNRDQRGERSCRTRPLSADVAEAHVVALLRDACRFGGLADRVRELMQVRVGEKRSPLQLEKDALEQKIATSLAERSRIVAAFPEGDVAMQRALSERLSTIETDVLGAHLRVTELDAMLEVLSQVVIGTEMVAKTLADFDAAWDLLNSTNQQRLLNAVVDRIETQGPDAPLAVYFVVSDVVQGGASTDAPA
jgi:site-specific DNA recombinase